MPVKIFSKLFSSKYVSTSDEELMTLIQTNDSLAFNELYSRYKVGLNSYFSGLLDPTIAEELMQETFIKILNKSHMFRFESKVKTWIWTIAKNTIRDHWRSVDHKIINSFDSLTDQETGEELFEAPLTSNEELILSKVIKKQLTACIEELSEDQREIVLLHIQSELSHQEISELTQIQIGAIKSHLFRAKDKLINCFKHGGHL